MAKSSSLLKSLDSSPSPKILSKKNSTTRSGSLREGILSLAGQPSNVSPAILAHKEQGALPSLRKSSNLINQNGLQLKSRGSNLALDNGRQRSNGKQSESFFGDDQTSSWAGEFEMERQRRQRMRQESLKNRSASKDASSKSYESASRPAGSSRHWMSGTVNGSLFYRSSPQPPQRPSPVPPPPPPTSGSMNRSSVVEYPFDRPPPGLENSVNRAERRKMIMDYESQLGGYVKRSLTTTSMESPPPEDTSSSQELSEGGRELVGSLFKLVDGGITEDVNAVVSPAFKRVCPITGMHLRRLASSSSETSSGAIWLVERPSVEEFVSGKYWSPLWASRQPKWVEMHELDSILRHQLSQMSVNAELQMYNSRWNWKAFKKTPKLLPDQQDGLAVEVPPVSEPHPPKFGRAAYSSVKQPRSLISWIPETPALMGSPSSSSSIVSGIDMPFASAEDLERHQCAQVAVLVESLSLKLLTCLDHTQEDSFRFLHHLSPLIEDFIGACMLIGGGDSVPAQGALEYSWDQDLPACLVSGFCQMVLLMHKGVNFVNRLFRLLISRDLGLSGSKSESMSSSQVLAGGNGSESHLRPSQSIWDCCMVMLAVLIRCVPVLVRCCKASDSWDDPVIPFGVLIKLITDPITHHDHQTSASCSSSSSIRILNQFWLSVNKPGGRPEKDLCSLYVHSQVLLTRLLINTPSNCAGRLNMALVFMYKCLSAGVVQTEMAVFPRPHGLISSSEEQESLQSHLSKGHCVAPLNVTLMGSPAFLLLNCLILGRLKQDAANVYNSQVQKVRTPFSCSKCFQLEFTHLLRFVTKFVVYEALATVLKHPAFAAHVSSERAASGDASSEPTSSSISPFVAVVIEAARLAAEDRVIGKFVGATLKNELTVVDPAGMLMLIQSKYEDIKNVVV